MHVVITGGAGFLGSSLARVLLDRGELRLRGGSPQRIGRLTVFDRVPPSTDIASDRRVVVATGDLGKLLRGSDAAELLEDASVVFHLAAAVSGECEADFDLGMYANIECSRLALEAARALGTRPLLVFASSLAVFGTWPGATRAAVVRDDTLPTPRSSYGAQKLVVEQLVADYTRKGFVDGRTIRLMTVSIRPGQPNAAASSFLSSIVREPLNGERVVCPVPADTAVAISSPRQTLEAMLLAAEATPEVWGPPTGFNLPALELTVGAMVEALRDVAGAETTSLIEWAPNPAVIEIVAGWPSRFDSARARSLGLTAVEDYREVIRDHLRGRLSDRQFSRPNR